MQNLAADDLATYVFFVLLFPQNTSQHDQVRLGTQSTHKETTTLALAQLDPFRHRSEQEIGISRILATSSYVNGKGQSVAVARPDNMWMIFQRQLETREKHNCATY